MRLDRGRIFGQVVAAAHCEQILRSTARRPVVARMIAV